MLQVIQQRIDGAVDFYLSWEDYSQGFGSLQHEFWLGNDKIASLTNQRDYQLRIDFLTSLGTPYYATYTLFRVGDKTANYTLDAVGQYSGNAGLCDSNVSVHPYPGYREPSLDLSAQTLYLPARKDCLT